MSYPEKAVILAAGKGTRLGALTAHTPKPMLSAGGKPVLTHILLALKDAGVKEVCLVTGYLGEKIRQHYGAGESLGLTICYRDQKQLNGTGGALLEARDFCDAPFLMCFGDILLHPARHYTGVSSLYRERQPEAVLAVNWVDDPCTGAAVYFGEDGRIREIIEKPPAGTSKTHYNQAGCFVFRPGIFSVLEKLGPSPRGEIELTAAVHHLLEQDKDVLAYPVEQEGWLDIGTPELLAHADKMLSGE